MSQSRKRELDQEVPDNDWLQPRKIPVQNLYCRLMQREMYPCRQNVNASLISKNLHQNVVPNFTLMAVDKPAVFLKKFSPDGQYLFAFSSDQTCIQIFRFLGSQAGASLIHNLSGEYTLDLDISQGVFKKYFKLLHNIVVISEASEQLNRECSLFTEDGKYLIVASSLHHQNDPEVTQILTSNESLKISLAPYEDFSFHLIDIERGVVCDRLKFPVDRMFLTHNHGIYLYKKRLAILSLQHQAIHLYDVDNGKFTKINELGRYCYPDDQSEFDAVDPVRDTNNDICPPYYDRFLNTLKHRILAFLFRRSQESNQTRKFYHMFAPISQLKMMKIQLLDEDHILIKFIKEKAIQLNRSQEANGPSLFAVYRVSTSEIINIYENTSESLLNLADNFAEYFRNLPSGCSPSNNVHSKLLQQRFKQTILHARFGGQQEMVKRLLSQLPISCQSFSSSPYLDLSLFSYDDKWVSMLERPKAAGEYSIKFYNRDSGLLRYRMYTGLQVPGITRPSGKRLAAFAFHPSEPFAISVQRTGSDYTVNFHVPNDNYHAKSSSS